MSDRYQCPNCGAALKNAPDYHAVDQHGHAVTVMGCAECGNFYLMGDSGELVEVEAIPND